MLYAVQLLLATTRPRKSPALARLSSLFIVVVYGSLYFFYIRPRSQRKRPHD